MAKLYNLARMTTATTGTGTITLGSAVSGYLTFALAGVSNGEVVSYGIKDGANSEVGTGTYTSAGTTLTRTVTKSTNSDSAINLSGSAEVYITARKEDLLDGILTTRGDIIYRDASSPVRLAKGTSGQILTMGANDPAWAAPILSGTDKAIIAVNSTTQTVNSSSQADLTGLSFSIAASEVWAFQFFFSMLHSSTGNSRISLNGPASPTSLVYSVGSRDSGSNVFSYRATAYDDTTTIGTANGGSVTGTLTGVIANGANAGTVIMRGSRSSNSYSLDRCTLMAWRIP